MVVKGLANKKKKGVVLLTTLVISFFITLTMITVFTIIIKYSKMSGSRIDELRQNVTDSISEEVTSSN